MSGTLHTTQYVGSGSGHSGTDSGTTIASGGIQFVGFDFGTGTATSTTIDNGGGQEVGDSGGTGTATSTTISGGAQIVGDNNGTGTATSTTILSGGTQYVGYDDINPGSGTAIGTTIGSGGVQDVGDGGGGIGTATDTTISGGGIQYVGGTPALGAGTGTAISTTILSGGTQYVGNAPFATATAIDTTIGNGGAQHVGLGTTGTATSTTILSGGTQYVGEDLGGTGTATSTTIFSGGFQEVGYQQFGAGTATNTILSGGGQQIGVNSGSGTATSTTILSGGEQDVGVAGTGAATSTTIDNGGFQEVGFGGGGVGTATSTTINSGGIQRVGVNFGTGTATDTTISGGGTQYVGYADDTFNSGEATSTTILSGGTQYIGGDARATGIATSTTLSGGTQYVEAGGTATDTTIYAGGLEEVLNGGIADAPVIDGGALRLDSGASIATGPIDFSAVSGTSGGTLDLTGEGSGSAFTSSFTAAISGFTGDGGTAALSDIIDVTGTGNAGDHVKWTQTGTSGTLQVENASNTVLESLTLDGSFGQQRFVLTETGSTDQITYNNSAPCYRRGTLIEAARGQKKVEALKIGDKVRTASGALRPIKWIGQRSYAGRFVMGRKDILPVCIKAGALGENVPARDLWVSPNHAMYFQGDHLNGVLIEAKDLVNGVSIVQAKAVESIDYVHIELDSHDVIIAEGAPAETFIDDDSRAMFLNAHDYATLFDDESPAPAHYCAPRLDEGYEVEAVRQRLAQRAGLLDAAEAAQLGALRGYIDRVRTGSIAGWAQNTDAPEAPVCLDIFADGKLIGRVLANIYREDLKRAGLGNGRHAFNFMPPAGLVFAPDTIEVRRSLDDAQLERSGAASQMRRVASA